MPTIDELDARLTVVERHLGITPPAPQAPAKPTGLEASIDDAARPVLTWDTAPGVTAWEVHDVLNDWPLQATVTVPRSTRSPLKPGQQRRYGVVAVGPGGRSPISDLVDVPPAATPPPAAGVDLARWKLTIPERSDGRVVEIRPPALAGYTSRYFERLDGGALRLRVWHGGDTTAHSANPRTELRERVGDDPEGYWPLGSGRHSMTVEGQVNRLTKVRPHVVLHQCHDRGDDTTVWRLEGTKLYITDGDNTHAHLVTDTLALGARYSLTTEFDAGTIRYRFNGDLVPFELAAPNGEGYWKCGAYLQSNPKTAPSESTAEYAEVELHSVTVSHS